MPNRSGRITIELDDDGSRIDIRVSDTGRGIPDAIRNTLFEPFVSQGKENGTGLGLTVVQKIIEDHGGDVEIQRTSPEGTVFHIVLPHPATLGKLTDPQESQSAGTHASSAKHA